MPVILPRAGLKIFILLAMKLQPDCVFVQCLSLPIARALMQNGADIILADMKEPDGAFAASCYAEGRQCTFVQVNLLDEESIVKMVAAA